MVVGLLCHMSLSLHSGRPLKLGKPLSLEVKKLLVAKLPPGRLQVCLGKLHV